MSTTARLDEPFEDPVAGHAAGSGAGPAPEVFNRFRIERLERVA